MATFLKSASFSGSYPANISLYYDISQSTANNQSTITYYLYMYSQYWTSDDGHTSYINGNGVGTFTSISGGQTILLGTLTTTITHNDAGEATANYSASQGTYANGDASLSGSFSLPTIPRAATPSCDSYFLIGDTLTINTNSLSNAYHYKLTYKTDFQTTETTITDSTTASSVTLDTSSLEDTWLKAIPNSPSTVLTIYEYTYNSSGTQVGSTKSCTTYAEVKTEVGHYAPTHVSTVTTSTSSLTNDNTSIINGQTTINFNVVGTFYGYSSLKYYRLFKYSSDTSGSYENNTTGVFTVANADSNYTKYSINTFDSRYFRSVNIYALGGYFKLVPYSSVTLQGTLARTEPTSNEVKLTANGYYKSGTFGSTTGASSNSATITWKYRIVGADTWTTGGTIPESALTLDADNMKWSLTSYSLGTIFDYTNNYEIQFTIADKLTSATTILSVIKGIPVLGMFEDHIEANGEILVYW